MYSTKKLDKKNEVQAHAQPITRMRLTHDQKNLFTSSMDTCLYLFEVRDRMCEPAIKKMPDFPALQAFSNEIMCEKNQLDDLKIQKDNLIQELSAQDNTNVDNKVGTNQTDNEIKKLTDELQANKNQANEKFFKMKQGTEDIKKTREKEEKELEEKQHDELEALRNEFSQKMLEDAARLQELQTQKEIDENSFALAQQQLEREHAETVALELKKHNDAIEKQLTTIRKNQQDIDKLRADNEETLL